MKFRPSQPAAACDAALKAAVCDMDDARHRAVLWFADIQKRGLYRELGFANMQAYATAELKFSRTRTHDFLRLARELDRLPAVRKSLASGAIGYTKAVEIIKIATAKTEEAWITTAMKTGRRDLARKVKRVKTKAAQRGARQPELMPSPPEEARLAREVPVRVALDMTPEQFARFEALLEKSGATGRDRVETILAGLEALAAGTLNTVTSYKKEASSKPSRRRATAPTFQIHVQQCPDCEKSTIQTSRGSHHLGRADQERVTCDARVRTTGGPNLSTIAPSRRAEVLARDRFRCRAPGCRHTRFLEVHHVVPRSQGGGHEPENLITLCAGCHRFHHEHGLEFVMMA